MGREIKRVPLDFDWPLDEPWEGFLLPDALEGRRCDECDGSGQTHAGWWLQHFAQRISMLAADIGAQERGRDLHPWLAEDPYPHTRRNGYNYEVVRPSADMAELVAALAGHNDVEQAKYQFGSDYSVYTALVKASGIEDWGVCKPCKGEGRIEEYEGQFAERDAWTSTEPPEGEGWQLWETVSEGSPISPVFATREEFVNWLTTDYYWGSGTPMTKEQAERFTDNGWAPTAVFVNGTIVEGMKAV
jgi:hypothetical protein